LLVPGTVWPSGLAPMTRLRKDFETEWLRLTDIALQHPQEVEKEIVEFQRRWVEQLKTREAWACNLPNDRAHQVLLHLLYTARDVKGSDALKKVFAVQATIEFLSESNFPSELIEPLRNLVGELIDLHRSNVRQGKPGAHLCLTMRT
jgi:uncharacterized protein YeaO (DUF488 family)